jgi:hypothetical protein
LPKVVDCCPLPDEAVGIEVVPAVVPPLLFWELVAEPAPGEAVVLVVPADAVVVDVVAVVVVVVAVVVVVVVVVVMADAKFGD